MFDNLQKVRIYEEALELLKDPVMNNRDVWVHDFKESCYREQEGYTLNGLHWGYPDSLVDNITGKHVDGVRSVYYARFAGTLSPDSEKWNYADNSRFSKVKYSEIKDIVELGIRQKLDQARTAAQEDIKALEEWKQYVQSEFDQYGGSALRIEDCDGKLHLIALDPERFNTYGFGSFLEEIKEGDVSISHRALEILANTPTRSGLMGLELFANNVLSMIGTDPKLVVHPNSASMNEGAYAWLSQVSRVE